MEKVIKTVYSFIYPETDQLVKELWNLSPSFLYQKPYEGSQNFIDLTFRDEWLEWISPVVRMNPNLNNFYPTAGSSEAIRESIAQYIQKKNIGHKIHVFEGEYEGYLELAKCYGIPVVKHDRNDFNSLMGMSSGDRFYISQPSSIDGNVWTEFNAFIEFLELFNPNVEVMVDLCYVGTVAKDYHIDLSSKIIHTVFFSLSKVFGVYYHRIGGVFCKYEMPGLYANKWFKNIFSLTLGAELMKRYHVKQLPQKYLSQKLNAIDQINKNNDCHFKSSDVFMLGHSALDCDFAMNFERSGIARICITPLLDEVINEKS
jgi:hypothetical protein